jgi:hypothetical protein
MGSVRRRYDAKFKAKVAFDAAKQEKTAAQLSGEYGVHPNRICLPGQVIKFPHKSTSFDTDT